MTDQEGYLLDIPMCVYNHEKFIAQTIEGVLRQKTDFKYRLIIGEDCSTDASRPIIEKYLRSYPDKLKVFFHEKNVGPYVNSKVVWKECVSKYVALCDGDDYWCDDTKLQTQVDILEKHPEYVGCFHNTEERYEDDDTASFLYCNYPTARTISFNDLSFENVIPTCSIVYRNQLFGDFPEWHSKLKMGDWPLHLLNAQYGDFWYLPKVMGVHRIHSNGIWTLQERERMRQYIIEAYNYMIEGFAHNKILQKQLMLAKDRFMNPPNSLSPTLARRGINFVKRIAKKSGRK
ncbi:glycosyltransferase [Niastella caeni]|uniref:Glycosyltransferase n=1 Tax=Niastella caeni TaxID=2569763 RepID=A0A4S8I4I2_9BACT|nr:glycosyltransferase [Niastella caeni]THU41532.1 glycosyltransferase [Niastella caeni]